VKIPRRFQDLFNLDTELYERAETRAAEPALLTQSVLAVAAVLLDVSWLAAAGSVFFELQGGGKLGVWGLEWQPSV
jgi:hypothetical protein